MSRSDIQQIVQIELNKVTARLVEHDISLSATPEAVDMLAEMGYDPEMGARPLRRVIQQRVEDKLSDALLGGDFQAGDTILVDVEDEDFVLRHEDDAKEPSPPSEAMAAV